MASLWQAIFLLYAIFKIISITNLSNACNELVCASIVTKCMLIRSCDCSITSCTCCPSCLRCLDTFYAECCDCVGMCDNTKEPQNTTKVFHESSLSGSPELFKALLTDPDPADSWLVFEFPVNVNQMITKEDHLNQWYKHQQKLIIGGMINCSLVFLEDCASEAKCKKICESMGAEVSIWFQDGCCECSGCPSIAIFESRCSNCPLFEGLDPDEDYDYLGEDDEEAIYDQMPLDAESEEKD